MAIEAEALRARLEAAVTEIHGHITTPEGMAAWNRLNDVDVAIRSALAEDTARAVEGGIAEIAAERRRQVEAEGWTPEHDDTHSRGEMASAAACYALSHTQRWHLDARDNKKITNHIWPWDACWWKPGDRRRELVKAAALLVAEIERLDRLTKEAADANR